MEAFKLRDLVLVSALSSLNHNEMKEFHKYLNHFAVLFISVTKHTEETASDNEWLYLPVTMMHLHIVLPP